MSAASVSSSLALYFLFSNHAFSWWGEAVGVQTCAESFFHDETTMELVYQYRIALWQVSGQWEWDFYLAWIVHGNWYLYCILNFASPWKANSKPNLDLTKTPRSVEIVQHVRPIHAWRTMLRDLHRFQGIDRERTLQTSGLAVIHSKIKKTLYTSSKLYSDNRLSTWCSHNWPSPSEAKWFVVGLLFI